ncbi:MAG: HAD family phosphatase [Coriobacteriales bacterium]|nr:HAD family phosphatase [Coriobacteriales bacterium]
MLQVYGVIFDMDGLMFDTQSVWDQQWAGALAAHGIDHVLPGFIETERGTTADSTYRIIHEFYGPGADAEGIYASLCELSLKAFTDGAPIKPGLFELLDYLASRHIPCAIASSSPYRIIKTLIDATHVTPYFEPSLIVCGSDVEHSKPKPDIFLEAARRLGTAPQDTLVLEDSFNGVLAGAAGGFKVVMVPDLAQPNEEILKLTTGVCNSLFDVIPLIS